MLWGERQGDGIFVGGVWAGVATDPDRVRLNHLPPLRLGLRRAPVSSKDLSCYFNNNTVECCLCENGHIATVTAESRRSKIDDPEP